MMYAESADTTGGARSDFQKKGSVSFPCLRRLLVAPWLLTALALLASGAPARADDPEFYPYESYWTGSHPQAVAIGDVNSDGRKDIVVTTGFSFDPQRDFKLIVFQRASDGSFRATTLDTPVTVGGTMGVAITDLNADGRNDVLLAASGAGLQGYLQGSDGTLLPPTKVADLRGAGLVQPADFDADGRMDLLVAYSGGVAILYRRGETYQPMQLDAGYGRGIATGDLNSDGLLDEVSLGSSTMRIREQRPDGSFDTRTLAVGTNVGGPGPLAIAAGDVTGDGRDDVVLAETGNPPRAKMLIYPQVAGEGISGIPTIFASYDSPETVTLADLNRDARLDVVTLHSSSRVGVIPQASAGGLTSRQLLFRAPTNPHPGPQAVAVGDVNGDRRPDIALGGWDTMVLLRQVLRPNKPPMCSGVTATPTFLSQPDESLRTIELSGATDPDGGPVSIVVTGVTQDEAVTDAVDKTGPDAAEGGSPTQVELRAERNPKGDGRVYRVGFRASDDQGGSCTGTVTVSVPRKKDVAAVDSAPPVFDSLRGCLSATLSEAP
jgi:hypothetical protein